MTENFTENQKPLSLYHKHSMISIVHLLNKKQLDYFNKSIESKGSFHSYNELYRDIFSRYLYLVLDDLIERREIYYKYGNLLFYIYRDKRKESFYNNKNSDFVLTKFYSCVVASNYPMGTNKILNKLYIPREMNERLLKKFKEGKKYMDNVIEFGDVNSPIDKYLSIISLEFPFISKINIRRIIRLVSRVIAMNEYEGYHTKSKSKYLSFYTYPMDSKKNKLDFNKFINKFNMNCRVMRYTEKQILKYEKGRNK